MLWTIRTVIMGTITATSGGGFFASFLIGYFIKKVIKILMFVLGGILALVMYLQSQDIIDENIKLDKLPSSAETIINTAANTTAIFSSENNLSIVESNLGILVGGSVTAGFVIGIARIG
jgi:uncharacterized membrane protein (Fun14 family)